MKEGQNRKRELKAWWKVTKGIYKKIKNDIPFKSEAVKPGRLKSEAGL